MAVRSDERNCDPPPSYGDVMEPPTASPEGRPLLEAQSRPRGHEFSGKRFLLQWLGITYPYAFCCILLHIVFFGGGISLVTMTVVRCDVLGKEWYQPTLLTIAAGGVFIVLATLWPCAWYWQNKKFHIVLLYAFIIALFYVGIGAALASQVYEHYEDNATYCDNFMTKVAFPVVSVMGGLLVVFSLCSCLFCLICRAAGSCW